jgi:hypothetical protein
MGNETTFTRCPKDAAGRALWAVWRGERRRRRVDGLEPLAHAVCAVAEFPLAELHPGYRPGDGRHDAVQRQRRACSRAEPTGNVQEVVKPPVRQSGPKDTLKAGAKSLNLELHEFEVNVPSDLDTAMRSAKDWGAQAL